ncbi:hypothetical protein QBC33DRAFT_564526 [Phialemonium atrogriseum]|uniref:Uncharacterized protein n=1 Tax=Phialemonium atrogriseum TaxID=1093897 RepID=A0AAJ0BNR2_9PEZI|nr:uncharacterized protein QBC33DRAFT_564526 [Phialemonium atrogriseum]KAK1761690.1 hypothetical protein QBC33DRAFT_564526 [Phialemonium atrogriseum]
MMLTLLSSRKRTKGDWRRLGERLAGLKITNIYNYRRRKSDRDLRVKKVRKLAAPTAFFSKLLPVGVMIAHVVRAFFT